MTVSPFHIGIAHDVIGLYLPDERFQNLSHTADYADSRQGGISYPFVGSDCPVLFQPFAAGRKRCHGYECPVFRENAVPVSCRSIAVCVPFIQETGGFRLGDSPYRGVPGEDGTEFSQLGQKPGFHHVGAASPYIFRKRNELALRIVRLVGQH